MENTGSVELCAIRIYNEKGVILDYDYGYFNSDKELSIKGVVNRRLKENFTKKENFVLVNKKSAFYELSRTYILYIYEGNIELSYEGLIKKDYMVYRHYKLNNDVEVEIFVGNLGAKVCEYKDLIGETVKSFDRFHLPIEEEKARNICDRIIEYNNKIIEEEQFIRDYVPVESDFEK